MSTTHRRGRSCTKPPPTRSSQRPEYWTLTQTPLVGAIGKAVLDSLLPPRHIRLSVRRVKRPVPRFRAPSNDQRPSKSRQTPRIDIVIVEARPATTSAAKLMGNIAHSPLTELRGELPPLVCHDSQLPLQSRRLRCERTLIAAPGSRSIDMTRRRLATWLSQ